MVKANISIQPAAKVPWHTCHATMIEDKNMANITYTSLRIKNTNDNRQLNRKEKSMIAQKHFFFIVRFSLFFSATKGTIKRKVYVQSAR
jgi:hypothetical protein